MIRYLRYIEGLSYLHRKHSCEVMVYRQGKGAFSKTVVSNVGLVSGKRRWFICNGDGCWVPEGVIGPLRLSARPHVL